MDDLNKSLELVSYIVNDLAQSAALEQEFDKVTSINLYHRYLEYMHYKKRMDDLTKPSNSKELADTNRKQFYASIQPFLYRNLKKIDLNYILFLFQIYQISEGVKECCETLGLR